MQVIFIRAILHGRLRHKTRMSFPISLEMKELFEGHTENKIQALQARTSHTQNESLPSRNLQLDNFGKLTSLLGVSVYSSTTPVSWPSWCSVNLMITRDSTCVTLWMYHHGHPNCYSVGMSWQLMGHLSQLFPLPAILSVPQVPLSPDIERA